jgi:hypothetical protein
MGEDPVLEPTSEEDEPPSLAHSSSDEEEAPSEDHGVNFSDIAHRYFSGDHEGMIFSVDHGPHFSGDNGVHFTAYHAYNRADDAGAMNRDINSGVRRATRQHWGQEGHDPTYEAMLGEMLEMHLEWRHPVEYHERAAPIGSLELEEVD